MLFETQSKADNFIKYNSEEILEESGKAPVRSYYCELCGGYHVTSNPSRESGEIKDNRDRQILHELDLLKKARNEFDELKEMNSSLIDKMRILLFQGKLVESMDMLSKCSKALIGFSRSNVTKVNRIQSRLNKFADLHYEVKRVLSMSDKDRMEFEGLVGGDKLHRQTVVILRNSRIVSESERLLAENEEKLENCIVDGVQRNLDRCAELCAKYELFGKKEFSDFVWEKIEHQRLVLNRMLENKPVEPKVDEVKKLTPIEMKDVVQEEKNCETEIVTSKKKDKKVREEVAPDKSYKASKFYKKGILELIERIVKAKSAYESGDIDECEDLIDISYVILDDLGVEDDNTKMIKQNLDQLKELCN